MVSYGNLHKWSSSQIDIHMWQSSQVTIFTNGLFTSGFFTSDRPPFTRDIDGLRRLTLLVEDFTHRNEKALLPLLSVATKNKLLNILRPSLLLPLASFYKAIHKVMLPGKEKLNFRPHSASFFSPLSF